MPRSKGDSRPRGRMTAYAFFVQTAREEQKRLHPGGSVVFADFSRSCAGRWNSLSEEEKKPYKMMAERDKSRFEVEMKNFPGEKQRRGGGKRRRRTKDPNAPKRSLSAFFWFCNDERQKVKGLNPEFGIGDVAKELGRLWSIAAPEVKQKYQAMSDKDKARYEREMHIYKSNPGAAAAQHAPDEDEEEEESDDE